MLQSYRYLACVIGLMLAASVANLLLMGAVKYLALLALLALACVLYRGEVKTLLDVTLGLCRAGRAKLRGKDD